MFCYYDTYGESNANGCGEAAQLKFPSVELHEQRRFADSTVAQ